MITATFLLEIIQNTIGHCKKTYHKIIQTEGQTQDNFYTAGASVMPLGPYT